MNGDETVYGKFNYGKSEFGVNYSLGYQNFKGTEYEEQATYELESGEKRSILRRQSDGQNKSLNHNIQLTYSLSDSNYVFQSKLSASRDIQPHRSWSKFDSFEDHYASRTSSPVLDLYFHRDFRGHQSFTANAVGTYIKTDSYAEHNEGERISRPTAMQSTTKEATMPTT